MTERLPGLPWRRALPARVEWWREARSFAMRPVIKAKHEPDKASDTGQDQREDEDERDHGQIPTERRTSAITAQGASARASRSSKRF